MREENNSNSYKKTQHRHRPLTLAPHPNQHRETKKKEQKEDEKILTDCRYYVEISLVLCGLHYVLNLQGTCLLVVFIVASCIVMLKLTQISGQREQFSVVIDWNRVVVHRSSLL